MVGPCLGGQGREPRSRDEHRLHCLGHETPQRWAVVLPLRWELDAGATQACHVGTPEAWAPLLRPQDPSVPPSPQPCVLKSAGPGPQAAGHTGLTAGLEERPPASRGAGLRPEAPQCPCWVLVPSCPYRPPCALKLPLLPTCPEALQERRKPQPGAPGPPGLDPRGQWDPGGPAKDTGRPQPHLPGPCSGLGPRHSHALGGVGRPVLGRVSF